MFITIAFTACIQWHCWWQTHEEYYSDTMYTGAGVSYHKPLTEQNCHSWAISKIGQGSQTTLVSDNLMLGMANIKYIPETVQCWPLTKEPF